MVHEHTHDIIKEAIVYMGKLPCEVHSRSDHNLICLIVGGIGIKAPQIVCSVKFYLVKVYEELVFYFTFVCMWCRLVHSTRSTVKLVHHMREDTMIRLDTSFNSFKLRFPYEFQLFFLLSVTFFLIIYPSKRYALKSHPCEQLHSGTWMAERISMPCMFGCDSEVLLQKSMACHHIHDDFFVAWARFIVGGPSTVDKFKLAWLH